METLPSVPGKAAPRPVAELDRRILALVARGWSDREIGAATSLSPHPIGNHVERLCRRLSGRNRTELAAWAGRPGFFHPTT